jgi:hypothetical protein
LVMTAEIRDVFMVVGISVLIGALSLWMHG